MGRGDFAPPSKGAINSMGIEDAVPEDWFGWGF